MGVRRKLGWLGLLLAGVLAAVGGLAAPAASEPVVEQNACAPLWSNDIANWTTIYDDRGVTACKGTGIIGNSEAYLQIVDLAAGAKLRRVGECASPCTGGDPPYNTSLQYNKRKAPDWFDWVKNNVNWPPSSRLFSVSNASFLIDTSSSTTALSLPAYHNIVNEPTYGSGLFTAGWAFAHHEDAAWDALKRALLIGNAKASTQTVSIQEFPTHYTDTDLSLILSDMYGDALVGFQPLYGVVDPQSWRSFIGVKGSEVYILNTEIEVELQQANDIIRSFGALTTMQLDGGRSTQVHIDPPGGNRMGFDHNREVPDVLAVYLAPY